MDIQSKIQVQCSLFGTAEMDSNRLIAMIDSYSFTISLMIGNTDKMLSLNQEKKFATARNIGIWSG